MTTIDRAELLAWCRNRPRDDALTTMYIHELRYILDALTRAEAQSETRRQQTAYWQERAEGFEARIEHLESTCRVLVKEALDAETARDEHRRGKSEAEARIQAVDAELERHEKHLGPDPLIPADRIRRALDAP